MKNHDEMLKRLLLSTATFAMVSAAAPAFAQDDQDTAVPDSAQTQIEEEDEVVATGIRQAIEDARNLKRNADTAVDSITASDVSTLPDLSVAEALARVPGVVVQRIQLSDASANPNGSSGDFPSPEGGGNLVRGLTLVRSELNGRDAFSANGGRALDFGTIPPELIGAVDVYKNTSADLIEGGIGGSVNLRTLEPFDRNGFVGVVTADGTYTDLRDEITPDVSGLISNRWDTNAGEFGLLGSISYSELKSDLNGFQVGQLIPVPDGDGGFIATPGGFQLRTNEVDRERESYYLAGQWQNAERTLQATAKYALIKNEVVGNERTLEWFPDGESFFLEGLNNNTNFVTDVQSTPFSASIPACNGANDPLPQLALCETLVPVTSLYQGGVISNDLRDWIASDGANFSNLGIYNATTAETDDISLNIKWRPTDQLFVNLDGHRTTATSTLDRVWGGTRFFSDFEINPDLDNPSVTLIAPSGTNNAIRRVSNGEGGFGIEGAWTGADPLTNELSDPANAFLLFNADEFNDNEGDLYALRADVEYEFDNDGWFDAVKFGARVSERDQTNRESALNWRGVSPPWEGGAQGYLQLSRLDNQELYETVDFSDFFRGGVVNGDNTNFLFQSSAMLSNYDMLVDALANETLVTGGRGEDGIVQVGEWRPLRQAGETDYGRNGGVGRIEEDVQNFYARVDLGQEFDNGMSIDANVGVRLSRSKVAFDGQLNYAEILDNPNTERDEREDYLNFVPETLAFLDQPDEPLVGETEARTEFLPSVNVKVNLSDSQLIRFGMSENITRPSLGQLRPNQTVSVSTFDIYSEPQAVPGVAPDDAELLSRTVTRINRRGGNPNLQPTRATNLDLSYELYWGDSNTFSVSGFRKDITGNIIYADQTIGTNTLDETVVPVVYNGDVNQDEATINGVEIAYTQFYDQLPGLLSNLGLQANYTFIDASTNAPLPIVDADGDGAPDTFERIFRFGVDNFPGLSEHAFNVIGIYQSDALEFRLAYNWRDDYLSSYRDFVTGNPIFQTERGYLDGSIKFDLNDNIQLRAQVANILDTKANAEQQIDATGQRFGRTSFVGDRRIKVGLRYQF